MFDLFGEFDSAEELNLAAAGQREQGDREALLNLAKENGIDQEDVEDYMDGLMDELVTPLMAAVGKIEVENKHLKLAGVLEDWKDAVLEICTEDEKMQRAVRKKGKSLKGCMALLLAFAFENKVQVSEEVVKATKVKHNGKTEPMRGPVYLGIPNRHEVRQIVKKYYGVEG